MMQGKHIVLGITGGIAAYKAASLTRLFVKGGAEVKIIMTPFAKEFITPVTLATLSKNTVLSDFFKHDDGEWNSHVDLGLWADLFVIAPCTANTVAKMANGICDNLLLTSYLSTRADVLVAPAMDLDMYKHPATRKNLETIRSFGNIVVEPALGELASGLEGKGRMEEPEKIYQVALDYFSSKKELAGKKILVTAGPTYEKIDPVRFVGNFSSGKMGYAIAEELALRGAEVVLVSGPVSIDAKHPQIEKIPVVSASEMFAVAKDRFGECDAAVLSAAVADYSPSSAGTDKLKSSSSSLVLELQKTVDIAAELGKMKKPEQRLVGFALETSNEEGNATKKLKEKNLDFIVLNSLQDKGAGFQCDTNKVKLLYAQGEPECFELKLKTEVASDIVDRLSSLL